MTDIIEILYLISASIAVLAMVPQIKQLVLTRQSDELSLSTWTTWGCCQVVSLLYALSLHATAYIIVNVAWITFYGVMVTLIIKYRKKRNILRMVLDLLRRRKTASLLP